MILQIVALIIAAACSLPMEAKCTKSFECSNEVACTDAVTASVDCNEGCNLAIGSLFLPRPQGQNTAALYNPYYYGPGTEDHLGYVTLGYRFNQTFRGDNIARCLFGSDCLYFSGSKVDNPLPHDILADYFGLSPNFRGKLNVRPRIQNHIIDFTSRVEFSQWNECLEGVWAGINAAVVHSVWDLRACETRQTPTANEFVKFPECYMADIDTPLEAAGDLHTALSGDYLFGDMQSAWRYGRFNLRDSSRATKLANIDLFLGYDFLLCDDYHMGIFVKGVAPTGTKPDGYEVFQPIIGNGHHWEFGGGLTAHYEFLTCDEYSFGAYLDGVVTHLFKDSQYRTFDLKRSTELPTRGVLSRYMLLKEFDANKEYTGRLVNAVNVNTRRINSEFGVQGDASLRLLYRTCGWILGLGYNIFGRSREKITGMCEKCPEYARKNYGIKGTSGVCALSFVNNKVVPGQSEILHTTQSQARIYNIDGLEDLTDNAVAATNPQTKAPYVSWDSPDGTNFIQAFDSEDDKAKADPVFLTASDLDRQPVPAFISHKVFGTVDYAWQECACYEPYVGLGWEVEFAQNSQCHPCTVNQWGIWLRGGFNF